MTDPAELLVCGGPNGTGKTSLAREYASAKGIVYLGADEIAEMLSPGNAAHAKIEAGRRFLAAVNDHLSAGTSMVVETTLSGLAFRKVLSTAKSNGFEITIAYLFLDSADACVARVEERVRKGGHHVPEVDVRRRFSRSIVNFWNLYREMADNWVLLYNGLGQLQDVAAGARMDISVRDPALFSDFMAIVGASDDD